MAIKPRYLIKILPIFLSLFVSTVYSNSSIDEETTAEKIEVKDMSMIIIGASYARGWQVKEISCLEVINKGIGGEQSFETLARFEKDAIQPRPDAILIWGFINDLHRNPKEDIDNTKQRAIDSITKMVEISITQGITPILATEVTMGVSRSLKWKIMSYIGELRGKQSYQGFINSNVLDVNNHLRKLAKEKNILLIDIEKVMTNEAGERKEGFAQVDGSHITEHAYNELSAYALPILERALVSSKQLCN
ncbi:MAG: GDSL-type esterase/lipase family protein [Gammaproteobacteria bacterium]|nr:GDSL-type esterase/lipase family protein [Gammaproteobacteria bacterium]